MRPFWQAVLGYADEPGHDGPPNGLVDPLGQGPAVWFQQMDAPRPQRNRIHVDVPCRTTRRTSVSRPRSRPEARCCLDAEAPAFWVLADPEGNEACVTTWQGRDGSVRDLGGLLISDQGRGRRGRRRCGARRR